MLVTVEKILLMEGMMVGGRKPATTMTSDAANSEYSIMSCPRQSLQSRRMKRGSTGADLLSQ
jgi:hypothetical protein